MSTSTAPRVSSPLASYSTTASSDSEEDSEVGDEVEEDEWAGLVDGGEDDDSDMSDGDDDDDDDQLEGFLQAARKSAQLRAAAAATAGKDSLNLEDVDLAKIAAEDNDRLPAVYTQPAVASQVFANPSLASDFKGKSRASISNDTGDNDNDEGTAILPGVTTKWGEMPRARRTKSSKRAARAESAGKGWFDMPRRSVQSLSGEEKREIQALRLSNAMDPKRFMRGEAKRDNKKLPEYFQMGHVIESGQGPRAGLHAPSTKKSSATFLSNLLGDDKGLGWTKRKYAEVQAKAQSGGRGFAKKRQKDRKSGYTGTGGGAGKKRRSAGAR